jgi:hypothetical protein
MNRDKIIAALALAAVSTGLVVALSQDDLAERGASGRARLGESKVVELPDAGIGYAYPVDLDDGGVEYRVTSDAPCVRRPEGAPMEACLRAWNDGGSRDFGALNRFPASEAVGAGCEGVACSITFGEDDRESDAAKVERARGRR